MAGDFIGKRGIERLIRAIRIGTVESDAAANRVPFAVLEDLDGHDEDLVVLVEVVVAARRKTDRLDRLRDRKRPAERRAVADADADRIVIKIRGDAAVRQADDAAVPGIERVGRIGGGQTRQEVVRKRGPLGELVQARFPERIRFRRRGLAERVGREDDVARLLVRGEGAGLDRRRGGERDRSRVFGARRGRLAPVERVADRRAGRRAGDRHVGRRREVAGRRQQHGVRDLPGRVRVLDRLRCDGRHREAVAVVEVEALAVLQLGAAGDAPVAVVELRRRRDARRAEDDGLALDGRLGILPGAVRAAEREAADRVRALLHPAAHRDRRGRLHPAGREALRRAGLEEDADGAVRLAHRAGEGRPLRLEIRLAVDVPAREERQPAANEVLVDRVEVVHAQAGDAVHGGDEAVRARVGGVPETLRLADADVVVGGVGLGRGRILVQADRPRGFAVAGRGDLHGVERQVAAVAPAVAAVLHEDVHELLVVVRRHSGVRAALVPEDGAELRAEDRRHHVVPEPAVRRAGGAVRLVAVGAQDRRGEPLADGRAAGRGVDDADRDILAPRLVRVADVAREVERDAADVVAVGPRRGRPVVALAVVLDRVVHRLDGRQVEELLLRRVLGAARDAEEADAVVVPAEVLDRLRLLEVRLVLVIQAAVHVALPAREEDVADEDVRDREGLARVVGDRQRPRLGRELERLRERRLPEPVGARHGGRRLIGERDGHGAARGVLAPHGDPLSSLEDHVVLPVGGHREIARRGGARQRAERHPQHCRAFHGFFLSRRCRPPYVRRRIESYIRSRADLNPPTGGV